MKPNLFSIATKELSQDAFVTWLLQWADDSYLLENKELCNAGKEFIKKLISLKFSSENIAIKKVKAERQWANIDIWAEINGEYILIIEDKVNTTEHDNQLERYKTTVEEYYGKDIKTVFIYLKTGLECFDNIQKIKDKGWSYFSRKDFIDFLKNHNSNSEIYSEFLLNLSKMQKESECFSKHEKLDSYESTKGLYSYIESRLTDDWAHWDYVSNPNGGFLGLWFHFIPCKKNKNRELYLQIENYCNGKINLFIKICGAWSGKLDYLYKVLNLLKEKAEKFHLSISKPSRYRIGEYTSVAIIDNVFLEKGNGELDLDNLMYKLNNASKLIDCIAEII